MGYAGKGTGHMGCDEHGYHKQHYKGRTPKYNKVVVEFDF